MQKRGQAAMEFLMTYGWAILVVLAAIAALAYFGVLSPGKLLPERCEFSAGLSCVDKPVIQQNGDIIIALKNNVGQSIDITGVSLIDGDCTTPTLRDVSTDGNVTNSTAANVQNNANIIAYVACGTTFSSGDRVNAEFTVNYLNTETGLGHNLPGTISGRAS